MMRETKPSDVIGKCDIDAIVVPRDSVIDANYGIESVKINADMIEELRKGKCLYIDVNFGEYALLLYGE